MPVPVPYDDVFDAIQEYLGQAAVPGQWDFTIAPLVYENETDSAPAGEVAPWVLVILETTLYGQQTVGGGEAPADNRWDEDGKLWFHVFTPRGTNSREARRIAKGLANMFRGTQLLDDQLYFGDADLSSGDPGKENANYYLLSVSLDWYRTEAQ
jgi:hypothetical protein